MGKEKRRGIATSTPWKGFAFSCVACCAAESVTIPIDVVKTRLQLQGELGATRQYNNAVHALKVMAQTEGLASWFKGLAPALLRQATYGTIRYGAYEPFKKLLGVDNTGESAMWKKVVAGSMSGAISSSLCNPTDVVKVRLQGDQATDSSAKRYRGTAHAFRSIWRNEGFGGLYRGVGPTCSRATLGAAVELSTYDSIKGSLVGRGWQPSSLKTHLASSLTAGLLATIIISPFDVVKSRVMNQPVDAAGQGKLYRNMLDAFAKITKAEGVKAFWKGFGPNYARVGPRVVIIFLLMEQMRNRFD